MAAASGTITFEDDIAAEGGAENAIDDIFGDDDPFNIPEPLPALDPGDSLLGLDPSNEDDESKKSDKKKVAKKRSPMPRLNEARLCSDRGIPALVHLCDNIKFKGKGHEVLAVFYRIFLVS
ncbi:predicted protein [Nematostella vectensis]|uniref:TIMELESS-interacting protein n=1 Tax=Nematostella vectensis TaxID=45351 RepID=A7SSD8_NEMVE|nr:predicted protein [Nematostella vectensis]|eukprot:XP_001625501.1 predicted protein [Nematostella vectensis]